MTSRPVDARIVAIRAEHLLNGWAPRTAMEMAYRYTVEAERGGNPAAIRLARSVLAEIRRRTRRNPAGMAA